MAKHYTFWENVAGYSFIVGLVVSFWLILPWFGKVMVKGMDIYARYFTWVMGVLLLAVSLSADEPLPLSFTVDRPVCLAPCPVKMLIHVEPHADNRTLTINIDGDRDTARPAHSGTEFQVDGINAPKTTQITIVLYGDAEYTFLMTLKRQGGKEFYFKRFVKVGVDHDGR